MILSQLVGDTGDVHRQHAWDELSVEVSLCRSRTQAGVVYMPPVHRLGWQPAS